MRANPAMLAPARRDAVTAAFLAACRLDVAVRKPGNVSQTSPGHGMLAAQFIASAEAAAPGLTAAGARVGKRIEAAVQASWQAAGCNTNLGIVLLCAPLAAAAEHCGPQPSAGDMRTALAQVLDTLDLADADAAFRAITLAQPGGLGHSHTHDVREPARTTLREAMAVAAARDSIARQYRDGYADLFDTGLAALAGKAPQAAAVQCVYLGFLSGWPDSHIVRKHGDALAHSVMAAAQPWAVRALAGENLENDPKWAAWDADLKLSATNPGTSADLTVATLMLAGLLGWVPA